MKKKMFVLTAALLSCLFNVNAPLFGKGNDQKETGLTGGNLDNFPSGGMEIPSGTVRAFDLPVEYRKILTAELENLFGDNVVYRLGAEYTFNNAAKSTEYFLIVFDFKKNKTDNIKKDDAIGTTASRHIKLLVFARELDPYLTMKTSKHPYRYGDFYWYYPDFLFQNSDTDFFSFVPVDKIEDILTAGLRKAGAKKEIVTGARFRHLTSLSAYPVPLPDSMKEEIHNLERLMFGRENIISHFNEIKYGDITYLLCWQGGFADFLKSEYALGSNIWLYDSVVSYDRETKRATVFVVDFSLLSVEEMYASRVREMER
jgi:hypothetical protein